MSGADFKPPIPSLPPYLADKVRFATRFDRMNPTIPPDLVKYTKGVHHIATKQVPTALAIRHPGSSTLKKKLGEAVSLGFRIQGTDLTSEVNQILTYEANPGNLDQLEITKGEEVNYESLSLDYRFPMRGHSYRLEYEDFFRIIAGRFLARDMGMQTPELIVWPGDGLNLSGEIPGFIMGKLRSWNGSTKNSIKFSEIIGVQVKMELLMSHTWWGVKLISLMEESKKITREDSEKSKRFKNLTLIWSKTLYTRIKALLLGAPDPLWNGRQVYDSKGYRSEKSRALRFIECLKTADGIFLQNYVAVPEEVWNWEKFDLSVLKNLSSLIGDEFFDGDVKVEYHDVTTRYTELKRARKTFKMLSNLKKLEDVLSSPEQRKNLVSPWLRFLIPLWDYTRGISDPVHSAYTDGVLSQTRGAGQPPELVKMQSKRKFIKTVSSKPKPMSNTSKAVLQAAILRLNAEIPEEIFTGLDTKARISINANACWEKSRAEGGTVETIAEIVTDGQAGVLADIRDLQTGAIESKLALDATNTGTYIFWRCLDVVLKQSPEEIRMAALVMISEPGKARTVTKSTAALKIVLDVINKICAWPLSKIPSSASGMHASSHAWKSFRESWTDEGKKFVFAEQKRSTRVRPDGSREVERTYRDLWVSSTDYSEATDKMPHEVAKPIAKFWMTMCGIPPILQMIVRGTCFVPREIVFEAYGPMSEFGEPWHGESPFKEPRHITLQRGILMGDPLTKVILHLVNILVRITGEHYANREFIRDLFPWDDQEVREYIEKYCSERIPSDLSFESEFPFEPPEELKGGPKPVTTPTPLSIDSTVKVVTKPIVDKSIISVVERKVPERPGPSKEEPKLSEVLSPEDHHSPKQKPVPLSFVLTDSWMRSRPKIEVDCGNGAVKLLTVRSDFKPKKQKSPGLDRQVNMQNVLIKHALQSHHAKASITARIREESLTRAAMRNGFQWNAVAPNKVQPKPTETLQQLQEAIKSHEEPEQLLCNLL